MSRFHGTRQRRAFDVWQIVYIDLMTNVMIFFVVLWAVQSGPKKSGISDTVGTETVKMVDLPAYQVSKWSEHDVSPRYIEHWPPIVGTLKESCSL